ncbi:hypothetical protein C8R42DRAFT_717599 [Lentinula raphanica]|nr:hypothetical protein C8R42DRAFT_717599 [Lentinula raphanica]
MRFTVFLFWGLVSATYALPSPGRFPDPTLQKSVNQNAPKIIFVRPHSGETGAEITCRLLAENKYPSQSFDDVLRAEDIDQAEVLMWVEDFLKRGFQLINGVQTVRLLDRLVFKSRTDHCSFEITTPFLVIIQYSSDSADHRLPLKVVSSDEATRIRQDPQQPPRWAMVETPCKVDVFVWPQSYSDVYFHDSSDTAHAALLRVPQENNDRMLAEVFRLFD